jgi:hypothetical protein
MHLKARSGVAGGKIFPHWGRDMFDFPGILPCLSSRQCLPLSIEIEFTTPDPGSGEVNEACGNRSIFKRTGFEI